MTWQCCCTNCSDHTGPPWLRWPGYSVTSARLHTLHLAGTSLLRAECCQLSVYRDIWISDVTDYNVHQSVVVMTVLPYWPSMIPDTVTSPPAAAGSRRRAWWPSPITMPRTKHTLVCVCAQQEGKLEVGQDDIFLNPFDSNVWKVTKNFRNFPIF